MPFKTLIGLALAASLAHPIHGQQQPLQQKEHACGLYLAPSSRPRKSPNQAADQWGIYAGKTYYSNDTIGFPDVAINVHALRAHNTRHDDQDQDEEQDFLAVVAETIVTNLWDADIAGAGNEVDDEDGGCEAFLPGPGILADYNTKLANTNFDVRSSYQRITTGEEPGKAHPGRGANSPFYNFVVRATKEIDAGDEIIINFDLTDQASDESATNEMAIDEDGEVNPETTIVEEDYTRIDQTVEQLLDFFQKHDKTVDEAGKLQIYRFMTDDFLEAAVGPVKAKLIEALLPMHPNDLAAVKKAGGIKKYSQMSQKEGGRTRSLEWLQENGMCMDNIRSGPSRIPNAGRGAFANRKIIKGGLVAPTPLFLIPDKASMDMYELQEGDEDGTVNRSDEEIVRGQQLLVNYMYSHPKSTMGFVPTGTNVNLINHADKPNAKMQWSTHPMHVKEYMEISPVKLMNYRPIGVVMEILAVRDIEEGEEITIDYGSQWQEAWNKYTEAFESKRATKKTDGTWPLRACDLNAKLAAEPILTEEEQQDAPYPDWVTLKVFAMTDDDELLGDGSEGNPYIFDEPDDQTMYVGDDLVEPVIVKRVRAARKGGEFAYTIRYVDPTTGRQAVMTDVPQHAFVFVDDSETGDQFMPEPFRHYIEIPDEVFPQGPWRNVR